MHRILVVGAGLAGAVHARVLAERGLRVEVIDKRDHIAGNCFDQDHPCGVRMHRYGPHLFHTSNQRVVDWLSRFTEWTRYEHEVVARLGDGRLVPMPVNLDTVNAVFGKTLGSATEVAAFLASVAEPRAPVLTAEDHLYSTIGPTLTNMFFRPYTRKMWALDLQDMDAAVVRRLQIRTDRDPRYFPGDSFQAMPREGYTAMFTRIFDHPGITVTTGVAFDPAMLRGFDYCFNAMPIDVFFGCDQGELPYRSIRFHTAMVDAATAPRHVTVNYTDHGPHTRETWWHNIPDHQPQHTRHVLRTVEEPCDYRDNAMERYYPVKTGDGRHDALYRVYRDRAAQRRDIAFIGRCGTYQYLDMHQVVNQSLASAGKWLDAHLSNAA